MSEPACEMSGSIVPAVRASPCQVAASAGTASGPELTSIFTTLVPSACGEIEGEGHIVCMVYSTVK
jgi:hypothetical protein